MRILLITPYLPHPRIGHGGGSAVRSLARELAGRHELHLLSLERPGESDLVAATAADVASLHTVKFLDRRAAGCDRLRLGGARLGAFGRALASGYPQYVTKYASRALVRTALDIARDVRPDIIQVEYLQLALLLRSLRRWRDGLAPSSPRPRLVLDSHELGSLPRRRRARRAGWLPRRLLLAEAARWDHLASDASRWADATLCVTEQDRRLYSRAGGVNLVTVPLGIDTRNLTVDRAPVDPPQALFIGSFQHPPNRAAAALLCDRIWPAVRARLPRWELVLAGPGSDTFLAGHANRPAGVRATGFVDDLAALFRESRLFVAPLTEGGGIKIKILEALARGIPVVTTPIGAEGIVERSQDLVWWAEGADDFADRVVAAAQAPADADIRAAEARRHIEARFSWHAVVKELETVYRGDATGR